MRPPRIIILIVFLASLFFLLGRIVTLAIRENQSVLQDPHSDIKAGKSSASSFSYYNTPFSLFPPNAAISLTEDNSTSFAARPAAFGPKLATKGISGQLWIGQGFVEDSIDRDGERGCSDLPDRGVDEISQLPKPNLRDIISPRVTTSSRISKRTKARGSATNERISTLEPYHDADSNAHDEPNNPHHGIRRSATSHERFSSTSTPQVGAQLSQDPSDIEGKVALLMRGGCSFLEKVLWAQRRGAVAVIVGDNQKGGPLVQMFAHGDEVDQVKIPSVFTARTTAQLLSTLAQPDIPSSHANDDQDDTVSGLRQSTNDSGGSSGKSLVASFKSQVRPSTLKRASESLSKGPSHLITKPRGWFSRILDWGHTSDALNRSAQPGLDLDASSELRDTVVSNKRTHHRSAAISEKEGKLAGKNDFESKTATSKDFKKVLDVVAAGKSTGSHQTKSDEPNVPEDPLSEPREGLWVTITPTNSASPFFDTLLVLVVSPLVTLTVVYALLILRARIRRRRWRAPKSVVDRLPVRTYHTVAVTPGPSTRQPSPASSSPTTPLLQQALPTSRPRSRTTTSVPSSSNLQATGSMLAVSRPRSRSGRREHEKSSSGFSIEWQRSMGRQSECVVCLEEYIDGVSQVMSLPCGHEFHADCM